MKKFRVFYTVEDNTFHIDISNVNGTEWLPHTQYACEYREGANHNEEDSDFIHYSIIPKIKELLNLGYKWQ